MSILFDCQVQDATNFLYGAINTIEEQEERQGYTSCTQVTLVSIYIVIHTSLWLHCLNLLHIGKSWILKLTFNGFKQQNMMLCDEKTLLQFWEACLFLMVCWHNDIMKSNANLLWLLDFWFRKNDIIRELWHSCSFWIKWLTALTRVVQPWPSLKENP